MKNNSIIWTLLVISISCTPLQALSFEQELQQFDTILQKNVTLFSVISVGLLFTGLGCSLTYQSLKKNNKNDQKESSFKFYGRAAAILSCYTVGALCVGKPDLVKKTISF